MSRVWCAAAVAAVLAGLALMHGPSGAGQAEDLPIKKIMTKAHKGGDSLIGKLGKELKADEPEWAKIQKQTKELVRLGTALGKATPPAGEKESWEKLTTAYVVNARAMEAAANKMDREGTAARLKTLTGMCARCHKAHKGA